MNSGDNLDQDQSELLARLTVLLVTGLPGIGKSTVLNNLIAHWADAGLNIAKVEADIVRQEAIKLEQMKIENSKLTPLELEIKSKPVFNEMLLEWIKKEITGLRELPGHSIIILDKNFLPESLIEGIMGSAKENFGEDFNSFFILPQQSYDEELRIDINDKLTPYYLDMLCVSLVRVFTRKGHISLCHGYSHSLKSVVGVVQSYSGQSFQDIADKHGMKLLHFEYFNVKKLNTEPLRSVMKEKMSAIHQMVKEGNFDGDLCAEMLLSEEELTRVITSFDDQTEAYKQIAEAVKNSI